MKTSPCLTPTCRPRAFLAILGVFLWSLVSSTQAADAGSITGNVSNIATGNLLQGARVDIPALGLTTLTDNSGRYVLSPVPDGTHEVVVSYTGLDALRGSITVGSGQRAVRDFDLTSGIYQLDAFKVTGEREGAAVAITAKRNATNLKEVVSMDQFGNLPNMSSGEVMMRLPGVAGSPTEEGLSYGFNIRGMNQSLNTINIDGARLASLGFNRAFEMQSLSGAMFDQMELIKGLTPDKSAESMGGSVNLKTRSTLSMKEKRRFTYNFSVRTAPSFTQQIPERERHRSHPVINFGYQEVFSVLGGNRNLGVAVNTFYSENSVGFFRTDRDFQNTASSPAYLWSYQTQDNFNNRKQIGVSVKTEFRLSPNTTLTLNTMGNDNVETSRIRWIARAYTGNQNQNTVPSATTSIVPGYTDRITEVRAVPTSTIDMTMVGPNHYITRTRRADFTVDHDFGPFKIDYSARYARNNLNNGQGNGGDLTNRITNIGWILDRSKSDLYPSFVQTSGPDFRDPNNWRPRADSPALVHSDQMNDQRVRTLEGNVRYRLPTEVPLALKSGVHWRDTLAQTTVTDGQRRYNYVGTGPLPDNPNRIAFDEIKTGRHIPQWDTNMFLSNRKLLNPGLWSEDLYYFYQSKYSSSRSLLEKVSAGYLMADGKFGRDGLLGRTGFLTGVRVERTETEGYNWPQVRASLRSTAAQRLADPAGSADRDYIYRKIGGSYTQSFPSAHLMHDITPNLKARASWSTGFGRPGYATALPGESANENAMTLTVNNPALLPQRASNWDTTLDYYFEPVGNISVGWFHKTITDYIVSGIGQGQIGSGLNNGFNGEYAGFERLTSLNAGTAYVQGWEFSYQQQFTFLPGLLKGLSGSANYTIIDTHGDFGQRSTLSGGQVAGFIPRAINFMLSWRYRSFSTRVLYNLTSDYLSSYDATNPARNTFRRELETVNVGVAYLLRPSMSLNVDVSNIFNAPQVLYRGYRDRMQTTIINGVAINVGISGRF